MMRTTSKRVRVARAMVMVMRVQGNKGEGGKGHDIGDKVGV
jgi:hypothetical protein